MNEPLIPTKIVNPVMPSIPSMSNDILNTSTESTIKECDVTIDDLSSFIDVPMKDDTANCHNNMLHHAKKNNTSVLMQTKKTLLLHIMLSWPPDRKEIACRMSTLGWLLRTR